MFPLSIRAYLRPVVIFGENRIFAQIVHILLIFKVLFGIFAIYRHPTLKSSNVPKMGSDALFRDKIFYI